VNLKLLKFEGRQKSAIIFGLLLLIFYSIPLVPDNLYMMSVLGTAYIYIIFAITWDVFAGYAHKMNFGHALFVGIAGYFTALMDIYWGFSPWIVLPASALICGVVGMLIGYLTLRLHGPYFAMITIAFAAVAYESAIMFSEYTGGEEGIPGISPLSDSLLLDYYIVLTCMSLIFLFLLWFSRGHWGLLLKAISQNEDAVLASGIDTAWVKIKVFTVSGSLCGIGGSLYAYSMTHVGPTSMEQVLSTTVLIMAIVGGLGTITGPFLGAIILVLFNELARDLEEYRLLIYTVIVVMMIFFAPRGIIGWGKPVGHFLRLGNKKDLNRNAGSD
jgi:branched-chain amino acid transport system permease protein